MYKQVVNYTNYDGEQMSTILRFHLSQTEIIKLNYSTGGALQGKIRRLMEACTIGDIMEVLDDLIDASYGVKSDDGETFAKSKELLDKFKASPAYDEFYRFVISDEKNLVEFVTNILPAKLAGMVDKIPQDKIKEIVDNPEEISKYVDKAK